MNLQNEKPKADKPTTISIYFHKMHDRAVYRVDKLERELEEKRLSCIALRDDVKSQYNVYKDKFGINLLNYKEFVNNTYTDGSFRKAAMMAYLNRKNNHELTIELYNLVKLANLQKRVKELAKEYEVYKKLAVIGYKEYCRIVSLYYKKVQELMILDAKGYAFTGRMGWTCINRYKKKSNNNKIDYEATRKAKEKLIAEGKKPYDAEEAKWCKDNGFPYDGVKYVVLRNVEYDYELPLIESHIPGGKSFKHITSADYINKELRGKSYDDMIKLCHHNVDEVLDLDIDIKKKLAICLRINSLLYTKYIRHESQKSYRRIKIDW